MIPLDSRQERELKKSRLFAWLMGVIAPGLYLIVTPVIKVTPNYSARMNMMFYILLVIAIVQPALFFIIRKFQISMYQKSTQTNMSTAQFFTSLSLIRMSFVDAVYLYGLVIYILTDDLMKMLWFYPIGAVWLYIHWPRREQFEHFLQENR